MFKFFMNTTIPGPFEYIIAGLGNPGRQYENTRHNAGFIALDVLAETYDVRVNRIRFKGLCGEARIAGKKVLLLKPSTYMNLSGQSVTEAMRFYKIPPERVIVLFDDICLPPGKLRIRRKGSDGGHNGMKNIIYLSGSDAFPRIKLGIGAKPNPDYNLADWVLSSFSKEEGEALLQAAEKAVDACKWIVEGKIDQAMNLYNA